MSEFKRIVNVIPLTRVKLSGPQIFTYTVPLKLQDQLRPGQLVKIPFGTRHILGVTTSFEMHRLPKEIEGFKDLDDLLDAAPVLSEANLALAEQISRYYVVALGLVVKTMLPKNVKRPKEPALVGFEMSNPDFVLTEHQRLAVSQISSALGKAKTFLLKGVTGSGKTEVYMQVIERVLESGKQVIILVPEISLTPQAVERFARRFGIAKIALLHSKLKDSERAWMWQNIRDGLKSIIIGPRSAIFSPVQDLGLTVLDEEHDQSFKQFDQNPKYHARTVAEFLCRLWKCPLVLGDATPSVETYNRAVRGEIKLLELPHRIKADTAMPRVQIVDLKKEREAGNQSILSEYLRLAILDNLKSKKQVILFLNRRGMAPVVLCRDCDYSPSCADCATPLVWHKFNPSSSPLKVRGERGGLLCHHCGRKYPMLETCPNCKGARFAFFGGGTQRVEDELGTFLAKELGVKNIPVISRMDQDSLAGSGMRGQIYNDWVAGKIQILIGTQIISKGWDVARVGLVGIVSADTILHLPDFRSNERTFQVLTQVAGRTGRGADQGLVILQTYLPQNYAIDAVKTHNFEKFFEKEIVFREKYNYPPFARLVKLTAAHSNLEKAQDAIRKVFGQLISKREITMQVLGPVPAYIFRIRKKYRFQLFLKLPQNQDYDLYALLQDLPTDVDIDVDPESLL